MPAGEALQTNTALAHMDVRQIVHARINADDTMYWRVKADTISYAGAPLEVHMHGDEGASETFPSPTTLVGFD